MTTALRVPKSPDRASDAAYEARERSQVERLEAAFLNGPQHRCYSCGTRRSAAWVALWGRDCNQDGCDGRLEAVLS